MPNTKTLRCPRTGFFLGMLLLCLPFSLATQEDVHSASGLVLDPDGLATSGAVVTVFGVNQVVLASTVTGEQGKFTLAGLRRGSYQLVVEAHGFSPLRRILTLPLPPEVTLTIKLQLHPVETRITVTGQHGAPEEALYEAATVTVRNSEELATREVSHLPRQLAEQPGVLTQETTPGQGSPVLRGQGAQTVLYLLDGVRFNNSTYRSGNTQYLGWIPATGTSAVEVFLGPAGTQYGSDALGGAVHILSSELPPWNDQQWQWAGESRTFFQSANRQGGQALKTSVAGRRVSFSLGGSFTRAQNLRTGGALDSHSSLTRFLGLDSSQVRSLLGNRLRDTAYTQGSGQTKLGIRFGSDHFLTASWLQSEQWGVRRYDRLLGGEGELRSDFRPQRLRFGYLRYQKVGADKLQNLTATVSLNQQVDGQEQQTRETSVLRNERNRVTSLGYTMATVWRPSSTHSLDSGAEFYDEFVSARRLETDSLGITAGVRPRFPHGTRYRSLGLYLTDDWRPFAKKLVVEGGLRLSHFRFRTYSDRNVFNGTPTVPNARETFTDVTFHSGVAYSPREALVIVGRVARGFRAPTVFDLGQLGLTGGGFEVSPAEALGVSALVGDSASTLATSTGAPWQQLKPEVLWSFEGGLRWQTRRASGNVTIFDSEFFDALQRRALIVSSPVVGETIGGQTITSQDADGKIFVDLDARPVVSRANAGRVRIYGVETSSQMNWTQQWSSSLKFAFQRGKELDTGNFARRIAPVTFFGSGRWNSRNGRLWLEIYTEISGAQTRLNPAELNDPRVGAFRSPETIADFFQFGAERLGLVQGGVLLPTGETVGEVIARVLGPTLQGAPLFDRTKSFALLNLRGAFLMTETKELFFAVTNLTDENYRRHGSGFDATGVNLSLSYRIRFH